jgi:hypothetical protein
MSVTLEHAAKASVAVSNPPIQTRRLSLSTAGWMLFGSKCDRACKAGTIPGILDSVSKQSQSSLANRHIDGHWLTKWKG